MLSLIPSIAVLGLAAFAALQLALRHPSPTEFKMERATASRALALATAIQSGHFAEEWAADFHARFPALFGLEPMPLSFFVVFNLTWIAIWIASVPLLRSARKPAFFAAWFLAIAGMLNGVAHPLMAVASGGYFPGLISSPFIGLASIYLWQRLDGATSSHER
jgi:NO-binding membrane sensor protein with MHYT domain